MEKYQAQKNNLDEMQENVPQKSQDDINAENNANNLRNAADVAIATKNPYAMAAGYAVKGLDKVTGGKTTEALGKAVNKVNKVAPGGKMVQNASNKLSESGASDAIGKAASAKNGGAGGASKATNSVGNKKPMGNILGGNKSQSSNSSSSGGFLSSNIIHSMPKSMKIKLYIGIAVGAFSFLLLLMVFADPDDMNLGVTNSSTMTFHANGSRSCTPEEIENKLVYMGDSRVDGMSNALNNSNIQYYSGGSADYFWLKDVASVEIDKRLGENGDQVIVLSMGLNDITNANNYIDVYRDLITKYPNQVFIMSVNPIDESKAVTSVTNVDIENFNMQLSQNFPNNFIDTYSTLGTIGTSDGINYDLVTYQTINSNLTSSLSTSGKVMCSTGLTSIKYYNQNDYNQSYGYGSTIKSDGCGPTAMAMILSTLLNREITPVETADWSLQHGYKTSAGTSSTFFSAIAQEYGVNCETLTLDSNVITTTLSQGKPIIVLVGPGTFTTRNHFLVLTGVSSDGKISLADPLSENNSSQLWDMSVILNEGKDNIWAFSV